MAIPIYTVLPYCVMIYAPIATMFLAEPSATKHMKKEVSKKRYFGDDLQRTGSLYCSFCTGGSREKKSVRAAKQKAVKRPRYLLRINRPLNFT